MLFRSRSLEIAMDNEQLAPETSYTVRLYFSELENKEPGERIFDIFIQDNKVSDRFDIVKEAGQCDKEVIKTFQGIKAGKSMKIDLYPIKGNTIISGIEVIQESLTVN